jgi:hypothetical protein
MKLHARDIAWLLPFFLTACFLHKAHQQQVQPLAPPVDAASKPAPTHPELPPSAATIPSQPLAIDASVNAGQAPKPPVKRKKAASKNTQQADNTPPAASNPQPAAGESPGVSAIGQLSSGDPADMRRETVDSIAATERGLNGIGRTLSDLEQKTAAQIREFLKKAREALASGDVDGAHTLAAKAKVLLSELSQ